MAPRSRRAGISVSTPQLPTSRPSQPSFERDYRLSPAMASKSTQAPPTTSTPLPRPRWRMVSTCHTFKASAASQPSAFSGLSQVVMAMKPTM